VGLNLLLREPLQCVLRQIRGCWGSPRLLGFLDTLTHAPKPVGQICVLAVLEHQLAPFATRWPPMHETNWRLLAELPSHLESAAHSEPGRDTREQV
jgi:hypothetical protein